MRSHEAIAEMYGKIHAGNLRSCPDCGAMWVVRGLACYLLPDQTIGPCCVSPRDSTYSRTRPLLISDRRARLFACALVRRVYDMLPGEGSKDAVRIGEQYADGVHDRAEWPKAHNNAVNARSWKQALPNMFDRRHTEVLAGVLAEECVRTGRPQLHQNCLEIVHGLEEIWRCVVFGWLSRVTKLKREWHTPQVMSLAEATYSNRNRLGWVCRCNTYRDRYPSTCSVCGEKSPDEPFTLENSRLLVLSDALVDAGCDDDAVLGHLRDGKAHHRGCWVIDRILHKE